MKNRFNTYDIMCMVTELQKLVGMRVNQVYDIDSRTYVIRLQQSEEKSILLLESGNRFHSTHFEWPKNVAPSGFTMKLRKHLKNKRLEKLSQLGIDRIVDLQFGTGEAAYHIILELYDRGNIVLTDYEWTILNVLRPHVEGDKVRFAVKEKYPLDRAKTSYEAPSSDTLREILIKSKPGDTLKKILNPNLEYGASIIDHVLVENGLAGNMKIAKEAGKGFLIEEDLDKLMVALKQAERLLDEARTKVAKGYITQKRLERPSPEGPTFLFTNEEFHPMLYSQLKHLPHVEHETFDRAVDEFFSALEGQKIDMKTVALERDAMKKLQNVRSDHEKRVGSLVAAAASDVRAAELVSRNQDLVDHARGAIQAAIANQMSWDDIRALVKTAQDNNDPIASCIKHLKLEINHVTLMLSDPYQQSDDEEDLKPMLVDIDLGLTAYANARRYYDQKRNATKKQQKTLESAGKALKSAERKTKQTLKEAHTVSNIIKARKTYWFEKFYWFISSDNYLVIGGRDQQQNELLVKRYLRSRDVYVHGEVAGAASVIIRNDGGATPPPRTLDEAGHAAVAYSVAWEAKVVIRAWWVWGSQVSKSAPTGEFLTTGSFMIRGKKNYVLCHQLSFGFTFMFRLEDSCIERHREDRKTAILDNASDVTSVQDQEEEQEIVVSDDGEDSEKEDEPETKKELKLASIDEEQNPQTLQENLEFDKEDEEVKRSEKEDNKTEVHNDRSNEEVDRSEEVKEAERSEEENEESEEDSEDDILDTHVKVDHGTGEVILQSKARTISEVSDRSEDKPPTFPSLPRKPNKKSQKAKSEKCLEASKSKDKDAPKRGQKSKMKKIKQKYKFQDEEDREIALQMLQSAKEEKEAKKSAKGAVKGGKSKQMQRTKIPQPAPLILEVDSDVEDPEPEVELEAEGAGQDLELILQLCGAPLAEDELLFAVPVVAPYSALHNYKYKVKLTPGTSKRGKAAKTAVQVFLRDKAASPREKDLLKAVKEENIARNFPGKVKLSAPSLHKHKK